MSYKFDNSMSKSFSLVTLIKRASYIAKIWYITLNYDFSRRPFPKVPAGFKKFCRLLAALVIRFAAPHVDVCPCKFFFSSARRMY